MDPRPRNSEGQFTPETGGGANPSTFQAAYNPAIIMQNDQARKAIAAMVKKKSLNKGVEATVPNDDPGSATMMSAMESVRFLKEFAGGYRMKEDNDTHIFKEPGVVGHLKRHAGLYSSLPVAGALAVGGIAHGGVPHVGLAPLIAGIAVDSVRREGIINGGNILKTLRNDSEKRIPKNKEARASHAILRGDDGMALIPLSAIQSIYALKEFARK